LVQVGEPCATPNPSTVTPWCGPDPAKKPVDVTTKEMPPPIENLFSAVQFEATAYVPVKDSGVITPLWDEMSTVLNVAVVGSNVIWVTVVVGCPARSVPLCRNP
jgi:hypothetical protein